ncbi:MAG: hypothetical protein EBW05_00505 [Betaproteobacteria bacterium]|nr:hypothetical protein [Betaproteobacteria bacterium]
MLSLGLLCRICLLCLTCPFCSHDGGFESRKLYQIFHSTANGASEIAQLAWGSRLVVPKHETKLSFFSFLCQNFP